MMKKLLGILTFFAVFILGCSDSTEIDNEKVDQPIIEPPVNVVNFGGGVEETKATMQNDYSFKWDVNDNISIFGETANVLYAANKNYKVTTAAVESSFAPAAGETISWNGSVEHTFYAYYPYNNVSSNPKVVTIPTMNIEQNGANSLGHLSKLTIMAATPVKITPPSSSVDNPEKTVVLKFNHLMAFLEFRCIADKDNAGVKVSSINVKSSKGTTMDVSNCKIDITKPTFPITSSASTSTTTLNIKGGLPVTTAVQKAYTVVLPFDHTNGTLTFTVTYSNGTKQIITKPGVSLNRGKIRPIKLDLVVPDAKPAGELTVNNGQTIAQAITASGKTEKEITKIIYNSVTVASEDITKIKDLSVANTLKEMVFPNMTNLYYSYDFVRGSYLVKYSFPALQTIETAVTLDYNDLLEEVDFGLVYDFRQVYSMFASCPKLHKIVLRSLDVIYLYYDDWTITFAADPSTIDLVLNADGAEFKTNVAGNTWNGLTFKSITGVKF